jgi:tetratricopeptide (TPR) repeat protein
MNLSHLTYTTQARSASALNIILFLALIASILSPFPQAPGPLTPEQLAEYKKVGQVSLSDTRGLGAYLSARVAKKNGDIYQSAKLFERSLDYAPPHLHHKIADQGLIAALEAGKMDLAQKFADQLGQGGQDIFMVDMLELVQHINQDQFMIARSILKGMRGNALADGYIKPLIGAWLTIDRDGKSALKELEKRIEDSDELAGVYYYHLGMMADYIGAVEMARGYYDQAVDRYTHLSTILRAAEFYHRNGDEELAMQILKNQAGQPLAMAKAIQLLENENGLSHWKLTGPGQGVAQTLSDLATILSKERMIRPAMIYARLADHLYPDHAMIDLLIADLVVALDHGSAAINYYSPVTNDLSSPLAPLASLQLAYLYEANGKIDRAEAKFKQLTTVSDHPAAGQALADFYRRQDRFTDALAKYNQLINDIAEAQKADWDIFYGRGVVYERMGNWAAAEDDLKVAIKLNPESALALNYLGYSWADQGVHLDQALDYIKKAVRLRPEDGFIIDSLGWAYYQMGRFEDALPHLEKAASLEPTDPTIIAHLGDVYWKVGRRIEARFQWQRALDFTQDPEEIIGLEKKLAEGVPAPAIIKQQAERAPK